MEDSICCALFLDRGVEFLTYVISDLDMLVGSVTSLNVSYILTLLAVLHHCHSVINSTHAFHF